MEMPVLLLGAIIGFGIAAPVGPIGLLCIQRTLQQGRRAGLVSGLGAASADTVYGLVAASGLTLISSFLIDQRVWFALAGGLFLIYLGVTTFLAPPATGAAQVGGGSSASAYASTFLLTLTNPATILSFVAIFAGAGLAERTGDWLSAAAMVLGVFLGSAAWWLLLSGGVGLLRTRITAPLLAWINRGAGILIVIFGIVALWSAWQ